MQFMRIESEHLVTRTRGVHVLLTRVAALPHETKQQAGNIRGHDVRSAAGSCSEMLSVCDTFSGGISGKREGGVCSLDPSCSDAIGAGEHATR